MIATSRDFTHSKKLGQAVHELVTHPGRVQERLGAAFMRLHTALPNDMPDGDLRRQFVGARDALTFEQPAGNEGRIAATLGNLSDDDASAICGAHIEAVLRTSGIARQQQLGQPKSTKLGGMPALPNRPLPRACGSSFVQRICMN
jgi:hypothetical protein